MFDNEPIAEYLRRLFNQGDRTDDFRELKRRLFVLAADLDCGRVIPFGSPGYDEVPISEAVKASSALPGLYPPARIGGRDYVDGAVKRTLHASVALKEGVKLLICVNPIVPFDADLAAARKGTAAVRLSDRGLIGVLSQTFRALIYSRMKVGMERYARDYPDADVVLFEPATDDEVMFFSNMFSYADRRELAEHAYRHTRSELRRRADQLDAILARHGAWLDRRALEDPDRRLPGGGEFLSRGPLLDGLAPLDDTLDRLARALSRVERLRGEGGKPNGAQEAAANA